MEDFLSLVQRWRLCPGICIHDQYGPADFALELPQDTRIALFLMGNSSMPYAPMTLICSSVGCLLGCRT